MPTATSNAAAWLAQWRKAGPVLAAIADDELRALTDEEALAAADALLTMAAALPIPPERLASSGLITQQALLHRRPLP